MEKEAAETVKGKSKTSKSKSQRYYEAGGSRKRATARVRLFLGKGNFIVNNKPLSDYFKNEILVNLALESLRLSGLASKFDVKVQVRGGGVRSQAEAIRHGIARALLVYDNSLRPTLKKAGYLRRDPRERERKKYGYRGARRGRQFRKR